MQEAFDVMDAIRKRSEELLGEAGTERAQKHFLSNEGKFKKK